jgi:hypothetical protein
MVAREKGLFGTAASFMGVLLLLLSCLSEEGHECIGLLLLTILIVSAIVLPLCLM